MKNLSLTLFTGLALTVFGSSVAGPVPESIGTSTELRANIYFPLEKGPERTKLLDKDLSTIVLFRTQSQSATYMAMVEYVYCSGGASTVTLIGTSGNKNTRSIEIKKTDRNRNFNHVIADAMCKDYIASSAAAASATKEAAAEARPRRSAAFRPFTDEAIFSTTYHFRTGRNAESALLTYRGSGKPEGTDIIAEVTGINHNSGHKQIRTYKIPKAMCETGTGEAFVTDGQRGWVNAVTTKNGVPATQANDAAISLNIVDGICQKSGKVSLRKSTPPTANAAGGNTAPPSPAATAKTGKALTMGELTQCTHQWVQAFNRERGEEGPIAVDQLDEWEQWCKQGKRPD